MNINEAFPSNWLKAHDLQGETIVTITGFHQEADKDQQTGEDTVAYYLELAEFPEKKFGLNKTNAGTISTLHGPETDGWTNKRITIYPTEVSAFGKQVEAIRVKLRAPTGAPTQTRQPAPAQAPTNGAAATDTIGSKNALGLLNKVNGLTQTRPAATVDNMRAHLAAKFPNQVAELVKLPAEWPRAFVPEIQAWIKSVEAQPAAQPSGMPADDDIPF